MSTTTEQIQELQQQVTALSNRITSNDNSIATLQYNMNSYYNTNVSSINSINTQISTLQAEDVDLHREIHNVNNNLSYTYSYVNNVTFNHNALSSDVDDLSYTVAYNKNYQDNENVELHREIHNVNNSLYDMISEGNTSIFNISSYLADVSKSITMSDVEYATITNPTDGVYYFVYETD